MIPVIKEDKDMYEMTHVYERCFFCKKPTDTWHMRTNNPVCKDCAKERKVSELPNHFKKH